MMRPSALKAQGWCDRCQEIMGGSLTTLHRFCPAIEQDLKVIQDHIVSVKGIKVHL